MPKAKKDNIVFYGTGRRKSSIARVRLVEGTGVITINGKNIDEYLGFNHKISCEVEIPPASLDDRPPCGRVELPEREANERKCDFEGVEGCMTCEEAKQEASRCLRCDHFGYGIFKGGRETIW